MKKYIALLMIFVMILCVTACGSNNANKNDINENIEESNQEKYEEALKFIEEENYKDAIKLWEEIPDYKDSKILLTKCHYIYGCVSFNNKKFYEAYENFNSAKKLSSDIINSYSVYNENIPVLQQCLKDATTKADESAYYYAIQLVNKESYISALDYFSKIYESNSNAEKHIKAIASELLDGNWIGNCTVENVQFQVELSFDKDAQTLFVHWADRRNGYKSITSAKGSLKIYADKAIFSDGANRTELIFDFYAVNKMRISCNGTYEEKALYEGTYKQKSSVVPNYKITITKYPTYDIPDFFNFLIAEHELLDNDNNSNVNNNTIVQQNNSQKVNSDYYNTSSIHEHKYSDATCTQPPRCSCGETVSSALGHSYLAATCTKPETCKRCGATRGVAEAHTFTDNLPTCWYCDAVNPNAKNIEISYNNPIENSKGERIEILSYEITGNWSKSLSLTYKFLDEANGYTFYTDFYDMNGNLLDSRFRYSNGYYEVGYVRTWSNIEVPSNVAKIVIRGKI